MTLIDIKALEQKAKAEIAEEASKAAVEKLKTLYRTREKAVLALKNIDREIAGYLADVADNVTFSQAGCDASTTKPQ